MHHKEKEQLKAMLISVQQQINHITGLVNAAIPDEKPWYTPKEVAAIEGSSPKTVTNRCAEGGYPGAKKIRGKWMIPYEAVTNKE